MAASAKAATSSLAAGGLELRSAHRLREAAHWASWAEVSSIQASTKAGTVCWMLVSPHTWDELATETVHPPNAEDGEPNQPRVGWQAKAAREVESSFLKDLRSTMSDAEGAMLRSQGRGGHWLPPRLSASRQIAPHAWNRSFSGSCSFADCASHSVSARAVLSTSLATIGRHVLLPGRWEAEGSLSRTRLQESAERLVGGCEQINVFVRDLDRGVVDQFDTRRLEVLVDTTAPVCPLTGCGRRTLVKSLDAVQPQRVESAFEVARRRKEACHPELAAGDGSKARLVVLAGEVGGRFSAETAQLLHGLALAKVRDVPQLLQGRAHAAWTRRWSSILARAAAWAFALSLPDRDCSAGVDGHTPSVHEVLGALPPLRVRVSE